MPETKIENNENLMASKQFNSLQEFKRLQELPDTKPLALVNTRGFISYANHAFERIFALHEGDSFSALESEPNLLLLIESLAGSHYSSFHFDLLVRPNSEPYLSNYFVDIDRILIDDSEYLVVVLTSHEERKRIENRINNLHNALEYGNVAVLITDGAGKINYSSASFEHILGKNLETLYNNSLTEILDQYLDENDKENLRYALKNQSEWIMLISGINDDADIWFKELKLMPVKRIDSDYNNFILTANDITDYILKNRLMKKAEERQKTIVNNITDPVLIVRREKNSYFFENANEEYYKAFNLSKGNIVSNEIGMYIPSDLLAILLPLFDKKFDNENHTSAFNYHHLESDRKYTGKITFVDDPYEEVRLFIVTISDMTEQLATEARLRKAYEKETQLSKLKSAFLANMSHEIRTPLNAIVGYSDLLEDEIKEKEDESLLELTNYLKDGVKRLLHLVENIVEVSILESGEGTLDNVTMEMNVLIKNICSEFQFTAESKNIKLNCRLADEPVFTRIDENKFRKIIANILDNAIKYNKHEGEVTISAITGSDAFSVQIEDTGIGIHEDKLDKVLEPFMQEEDEGHKRNYEGAGLGLTIAHKLTQLMHGTMKIESKVNIGTKVILTFPLIISE
ncbi:MAG: PAS domain-containing sensor histidine kinase [bacterium]